MPQDPYQTLGISPTATLDDARAAFRQRVRVLHPDRFDPVRQKAEWDLANQMLRDLNEAWETIKTERATVSTQEEAPPSPPPQHFPRKPDVYSSKPPPREWPPEQPRKSNFTRYRTPVVRICWMIGIITLFMPLFGYGPYYSILFTCAVIIGLFE